VSKGFIHYYKKHGVEYATHCVSIRKTKDRNPTHDVVYLGKVIDKDKHIFQSRKMGEFIYTIDGGYEILKQSPLIAEKEKLLITFGDAWLLNEILKKSGYIDVLKLTMPDEFDTLLSLISYKLLDKGSPADYAINWWDKSYAHILYPSARMQGERLSEFGARLGDETTWRRFYVPHLDYISQFNNEHSILIDSTLLPNKVKFPYTKISNHNGKISTGARLIFLIDRINRMPIYFRLIAGNIVDVSTLHTALAEVKAFGVKIKHVILDAGYYSENNIKFLNEYDIPFIMRLVSERKIYNELFEDHFKTLLLASNFVQYKEKLLYVKRVRINIFGKNVYAYLMIDVDRKNDEIEKYVNVALEEKVAPAENQKKIDKKGFFIILSVKKLETTEILPYYYQRQSIEQVFDVGKNYADLLPIRVHNEATFRGHLMLSFMSTTVFLLADKMLKGVDISAIRGFNLFRRIHAKVFQNKVTTEEPNKEMNIILKKIGLCLPPEIQLKN
jgi:transposase